MYHFLLIIPLTKFFFVNQRGKELVQLTFALYLLISSFFCDLFQLIVFFGDIN